MAGKFLRREAIVDTVKMEHRMNAMRNRQGLSHHPMTAHSCGCPDPGCGAFFVIRKERTIPTPAEAQQLLTADQKKRKQIKKAAKKTKKAITSAAKSSRRSAR